MGPTSIPARGPARGWPPYLYRAYTEARTSAHGDVLLPSTQPPFRGRIVPWTLLLVAATVGLSIVYVRAPADGGALALLATAVFFIELTGMRSPQRVPASYAATWSLIVVLVILDGPVGALVGATARFTGDRLRYHDAPHFTMQGIAITFLAGMAGWGALTGVDRFISWDAARAGLTGVIIAIVFYAALWGLSLIAAWLLRVKEIVAFVNKTSRALPYLVIFGFSVAALVAARERWQVLGLAMGIAPILGAHAFGIMSVRRESFHDGRHNLMVQRVALETARTASAAESTLVALARALDARSRETQGHSRRVVEYSKLIAQKLGVPGAELQSICHGALLHDIGKIGVPDAILNKPGKLTAAERLDMRKHPGIGGDILEGMDFLAEARRVVMQHHERWDGTGYPSGLRGTAICQGARIFSVADTVDAITQDRPYDPPRSWDEARGELIAHRGSQFDPEVVDIFLTIDQAALDEIAKVTSPVAPDVLAEPALAGIRHAL